MADYIEFGVDEHRIELKRTSSVSGDPDVEGGQHFGTSYLYARVVGPWRKVSTRSRQTARLQAEKYPTARRAIEEIAEPQD